jgi:hypothetical protein
MLARNAYCSRVAKQYTLLCKVAISAIAWSGTSGSEGRRVDGSYRPIEEFFQSPRPGKTAVPV